MQLCPVWYGPSDSLTFFVKVGMMGVMDHPKEPPMT